ncbi:hypothetical protein ACFO0N_19120 [Halobium salinum]|uniref:DUF1508 domain-containing protein n=1 Tax=Halobium salinum TaxID=1364940 RepID=A0ABD5PHY3_9EURY|nr:hypothetical protein [Halobium salinum]
MSWVEADADGVVEWERSDGYATIRLRERHDGSWAVRLDRLFQAPEGQLYRRETAPTETAARAVVERWQTEFDVEEPAA